MTASVFIFIAIVTAWRALEEERNMTVSQLITNVNSVGAGVLCLEWFGDALAIWAGDSLNLQAMTYGLVYFGGFFACKLYLCR